MLPTCESACACKRDEAKGQRLQRGATPPARRSAARLGASRSTREVKSIVRANVRIHAMVPAEHGGLTDTPGIMAGLQGQAAPTRTRRVPAQLRSARPKALRVAGDERPHDAEQALDVGVFLANRSDPLQGLRSGIEAGVSRHQPSREILRR
jgi:hypothetical protein